jgi:hypothetical protein
MTTEKLDLGTARASILEAGRVPVGDATSELGAFALRRAGGRG